MNVEIVHDYPPNYEKIEKRFLLSGSEIFAYDGVIYHPGHTILSPPLVAHEQVHFLQQSEYPGGVEAWWDRFLEDPEFLYEQELRAHRVELSTYYVMNRDRNKRAKYKHLLARRLSSPTYGQVRTFQQVLKDLS